MRCDCTCSLNNCPTAICKNNHCYYTGPRTPLFLSSSASKNWTCRNVYQEKNQFFTPCVSVCLICRGLLRWPNYHPHAALYDSFGHATQLVTKRSAKSFGSNYSAHLCTNWKNLLTSVADGKWKSKFEHVSNESFLISSNVEHATFIFWFSLCELVTKQHLVLLRRTSVSFYIHTRFLLELGNEKHFVLKNIRFAWQC